MKDQYASIKNACMYKYKRNIQQMKINKLFSLSNQKRKSQSSSRKKCTYKIWRTGKFEKFEGIEPFRWLFDMSLQNETIHV